MFVQHDLKNIENKEKIVDKNKDIKNKTFVNEFDFYRSNYNFYTST
jgi:hypothetical protein